MLESEIRELRDDLGNSVVVPPFDDLVDRGRRRRRGTVVGIAAAGVLVVGAAAGAGQVVQQRAETPPASHSNEPSGVGSAEDILDDSSSFVNSYETGADGRAMSEWVRECSEDACPTALAWTDDNWATRHSKLIASDFQAFLVPTGIVVYGHGGAPDYVLTDDGDEIAIKKPTGQRPVDEGEIVIYRLDDPQYVALDPETGQTHALPSPEGVRTTIAQQLPSGELFAYGSRKDDSMVYASSTDGGRTWRTNPVPTTPGYATVIGTTSNAFVFKQGLDGPEVIVSDDEGASWSRVADVPFGTVQCAQALDDGRLLVTNGSHLYASTDASWSAFAEDKEAPPVNCLGGAGAAQPASGVVTSISSDWKEGLMSIDNGRTWTEVDPR